MDYNRFFNYAQERASIKSAFEDGMDELFRTLFNEDVLLYFLDTEATVTNVYGETQEKFYLQPYALTAKPVLGRVQGENEEQTVQQSMTFTVPNRQLDDLGIPHSTKEELEALQQCIISYKGHLFLIDVVEPKTLVADTYLFYTVKCTTPDKDSSVVYHLPAPEEENPVEPEEVEDGT